ncbi:MAG: TIGR00374 family protein, partial [Flavobacteriaceae bacterium]
MNKGLVRILKFTLPIALGVFLVWYSYTITSEENRRQIIRYVKEADMFWVGCSVFIGILSHISRAIRWNYLLEP